MRIFRPDAVVLDIYIPQMSGYAVAQTIRQLFTLIGISGVWKEFDHYLEKPADPAKLLALLATLYEKR